MWPPSSTTDEKVSFVANFRDPLLPRPTFVWLFSPEGEHADRRRLRDVRLVLSYKHTPQWWLHVTAVSHPPRMAYNSRVSSYVPLDERPSDSEKEEVVLDQQRRERLMNMYLPWWKVVLMQVVSHLRVVSEWTWWLTTCPSGILVIYYVVGCYIYKQLEDWSVIQVCYFLTVTSTTVGYGDLTPVTQAGRAFTMVYALIGSEPRLESKQPHALISPCPDSPQLNYRRPRQWSRCSRRSQRCATSSSNA